MKKSRASNGRRSLGGTGNNHSTKNTATMKSVKQTPSKDYTKRRKLEVAGHHPSKFEAPIDSFSLLSLETICQIMHYLSLYDVMKMESLSRKLHEAVTLHLRLLSEIDFTEGEFYGWMPLTFNDSTFRKLLQRCPNLISVYGLHPCYLAKRRQLCNDSLSVPGIIEALTFCKQLEYIETSDIFLLEALITQLPHVSVGDFRNRNGHFPVPMSHKLNLVRGNTLTSLQLHGVTVTDIPRMDNLQHLQLRFVKLSDPHPFRDFSCPLLRTFIMSHCAGPTDALKYVSLVTGLASAENLHRMELVRVPFLGGLFQHVVEDRWRNSSFRNLDKITFGACKHALETDVGYLLIACANRLQELSIQPSLTKDSFFSSLIWTDVDFPILDTINLGYVDAFPEQGKWTNEELSSNHGLADILEIPAMVTDIGMNAAGRAFEQCKNLSLYNAPHLHHPTSWFSPGMNSWRRLQYIHIRRCHAVWLADFCEWISSLNRLESLYIEEMFREPPRGCSRVGLSAGTGLGVSSALVTNTGTNDPAGAAAAAAAGGAQPQQQPAANQQPPNNNQAPADQANQQVDNNGEGDGAANQQAAVAAGQEDDAAEAEVEEEQVVAPDGALADEEPKNFADNEDDAYEDKVLQENKKNMGMPNQTNCQTEVPHATSSFINHSEDGPSCSKPSLVHKEKECLDGPSVGGSSKTEAAAMEFDIVGGDGSVGKPGGCVEPAVITKCCHCGCVVQSSSSPSIDTNNACGNSKGSKGGGCSSDTRSTCGKGTESVKGKGKGKSLAGKKKGIAKRSQHNNQVHKSCQAISEEIREAAKKAKEEEGEGKDENLPVGEQQPGNNSSHNPSNTSQPGANTQDTVNNNESQGSLQNAQTLRQADSRKQTTTENLDQSQTRRQLRSDTMANQARIANSVGTIKPVAPGAPPVAPLMEGMVVRKKKPMEDKCTSTSDPVIEDDHIPQVLNIKSQSLVNLSLRKVGVTDLVIDDCPRLQILTGSSCRVLKNVVMRTAPRLTRTSFLQCPRMRTHRLLDELCIQPPERNRLLFLRPMGQYKPSDIEQCLLSNPEYNYHIITVHDYSPDPQQTLHNRRRVASWLDLLSNINFELLRFMDFPEAHSSNHCGDDSFPWGRHIHRMYGKNSDGSKWELMTDIPWLHTLASAPNLPPNRLDPDDRKAGVYSPRSKGHTNTEICLEHLAEDIAQAREMQTKIYNYTAVVYVNMCDVVGRARPDIYV